MSYKLNKEQIENIKGIDDFIRETQHLIPTIRNIKIPNFPLNSNKETVFIEFRILPHIEYLIRNMILTLPNWSHTIICGNCNIKYIQDMNIHPNLKIIHFKVDNITINHYNQLLLSYNFWNNLIGEKILIHQSDSIIFHDGIDMFLDFDYIGAPCKKKLNEKYVGNGGFSLRTKKIMISCLKYLDIKNIISEDIFFTQIMIKYKLGVLADIKIANTFSQEIIKSINPLGGHKFWLENNFKKNNPSTLPTKPKIEENSGKYTDKPPSIKYEIYNKNNNVDTYVNTNYYKELSVDDYKIYKKIFYIHKHKIENNKNKIEIDDILYAYLYDITLNDVYMDIYENGVKNGYFYCSKQIQNFFGKGIIYKQNELLYYKKDNSDSFIELKKMVHSIYEKSFDDLINDIKIIDNTFNNMISNDIICCFIGDYKLGNILIDKIYNSNKKNLPCIFIFHYMTIYFKIKNKIFKLFNKVIIFKSNEYGNDIIPTIQSIHYILNKYKSVNNIYKFHTKSDIKWFNENTDYILNNTLIYNNKCNCISHPKYYEDAYKNKYCLRLLNENNNIIDKSLFVKGSIFYTNIDVFKSIIEFMKINYFQYFTNNCYDNNSVNLNSPYHFLERLFGVIKLKNKDKTGILEVKQECHLLNNTEDCSKLIKQNHLTKIKIKYV